MFELLIIGVGNVSLRDDGLGIHTIIALEEAGLPPWVKVVKARTSPLDMLTFFLEYEHILIIDALKTGALPGTIYKIKPEDLVPANCCEHEHVHKPHELSMLDVLNMANQLGGNPEVTILGMEPQAVEPGSELTALIKEKIPLLVAEIKELLRKSGPSLS